MENSHRRRDEQDRFNQSLKITTNAMAKLGKNEDVRVEVLVKICQALNCTLDDIVDILPDDSAK